MLLLEHFGNILRTLSKMLESTCVSVYFVLLQALQNCLPGMTVVEIFPLRTICLSPFFRFLRRCNERYYATNLAAVELLRLVEERSNLNAGRTASLTTSSSFALS